MGELWRQDAPGLREIAGSGAIPTGGDVQHNVAAGAETIEIVKPAGARYLVVRGEVGTHRIKAGKLAAQTFTDGDVDKGEDTITITDHEYATGDGPLRLSNSGGGLPTGLAADTDYWVVVVDEDTIKLAASPSDALRIAQLGTNSQTTSDAIPVNILLASLGGTHSIGGNQGAGNDVGFEPAATPAADVSDGSGSVPLVAGEIILFSGRVLTVRATAASDVLTWWPV